MRNERYYYVTFRACRYGGARPHTDFAAVKGSPAAWAWSATREEKDGPYVILYAEEISEAMYKDICNNH